MANITNWLLAGFRHYKMNFQVCTNFRLAYIVGRWVGSGVVMDDNIDNAILSIVNPQCNTWCTHAIIDNYSLE